MNQIGIGFVGDHSCETILQYSTLAEDNGYHSVWVSEDLEFRDAITPLASLAISTSKIKLATGILPIYYRSPVLTAMTIATLDELSKGRAILGLGIGAPLYLKKLGVAAKNPLRVLDDYIKIIRGIITGQSITYKGLHNNLTGVKLAFQPRRKNIPIYIAARGRRMFELAGRLADGVLINDGFCAPEYINWAADNITSGAESASRRAKEVTVASLVWVSMAKNRDTAKKYIKPWFRSLLLEGVYDPHIERMNWRPHEIKSIKKAFMNGNINPAYSQISDSILDATAIYGTPDECERKMRAFRSAGINLPILLILNPNIRETIKIAQHW